MKIALPSPSHLPRTQAAPPAAHAPRADAVTMCVYGSLLPNLRNAHLLDRARYLGPCKTQPEYAMYDMSGMNSFPAVCTKGRTAVVGALYAVDCDTLEAVDRLENHPKRYERHLVALQEPAGQTAWMYILPRKKLEEGSRPVPSGDWRKHHANPWASWPAPKRLVAR